MIHLITISFIQSPFSQLTSFIVDHNHEKRLSNSFEDEIEEKRRMLERKKRGPILEEANDSNT